MPTQTNEESLEVLITEHLTQHNHYEQGASADFNQAYAFDDKRLERFLRSTQPQKVAASHIFDSTVNRRRFLERVSNELEKNGVVHVLRKGVKHLSNTFDMYYPLPSELSQRGAALYEKNIFCVTRQLHFSSETPDQSIDLMVSLNGLPVMTMELKNSLTRQTTADAVRQYRQRDAKTLLLRPKRCAVHFAVDDCTVEMCTWLCGKDSWFLPFNKGTADGSAGNPVNPNGLRTAYLWEDILTKRSLSDILEHYAQVTQEKDKKTGKIKEKNIWPRYHQLDLVRRLLASTAQSGIGRRYLIQHSAGSGKSNSIAWLAYQLVEQKWNGQDAFDSVVIVTDRVNLDSQLTGTLRSFKRNEHIMKRASSSENLRTCLNDGKKIILTTVHKFHSIIEEIGGALAGKRFAVIIDEAHSSQSGRMSAEQNIVLAGGVSETEKDDEDDINDKIEEYIEKRKMARNANFYAFTATPKNKTLETFGEPFETEDGETGHRAFHVYTMRQAIEEGFILDVLAHYTTYRSYYNINKVAENDPEYDRKQANKKLRHFVESQPETVEEKAKEIVEHFHSTVAHRIGGQARCMVVTSSRKKAVEYFRVINRLLEERKSQYAAIVAFTGECDLDGTKETESSLNGFTSDIEDEFKKGNYRFLIVADKFQTGYDEPLLHTMYVDKPLHGVKTVQTLSRLNRTCPGKEETCVLDFVNNVEDVTEDFQTYYKTTILSRETDPNRLNDLIDRIESHGIYEEEEVERFNQLYWSGAKRETLDPLLDLCADRFNSLELEAQVECKSAIKAFIRAYEFLSTIMIDGSVEWEKKETFYRMLVYKLPSLAGEDLARGILEDVDFDSYRLRKQGEHTIKLNNENAEIGPVPTSTATGVQEPEMEKLSDIVREFNRLFGITVDNPEVVKKQFEEVVEQAKNDDTVRDSMLNSDTETANNECDEAVGDALNTVTGKYTELLNLYWSNEEVRNLVNQRVRELVRASINPEYNEQELKNQLRREFENDFSDLCDGEHFPDFDDVLLVYFKLVEAGAPADLQGLKSILRHTLNCIYRAQHREEDYRTWYATLVSRFEAFMKKIYWILHEEMMPLTADGRQPTFVDAVRHFLLVRGLYNTTNPKFANFRSYYNTVYSWRNAESHVAPEIPSDLLPTAIHAAVALYLFTTMVNARDLAPKLLVQLKGR